MAVTPVATEFAWLGGLLRQLAGVPAPVPTVLPAAEEYEVLLRAYRWRYLVTPALTVPEVAECHRILDRHVAGPEGRCVGCRRGTAFPCLARLRALVRLIAAGLLVEEPQ